MPRPDAPQPASGTTPKESDWISINPDIPSKLYSYQYSIIDSSLPILTGKQLQYNNYTNFNASAETAESAIEKYYNIDYRDIKSTALNDKDDTLKSLIYYVGEESQMRWQIILKRL